MRTTLLILSWLMASLLAGCIAPIVADEDSEPEIVQPDAVTPDVSPTVAVTASPDAFASIRGWLGDANTVTVRNATQIDQEAVTVNVPAGATVSYQFSDELGTFTFAKPLPTVKSSILGFKVSPSLSVVTLKPDGSGVAATGIGIKYKFRWLAEDEDAGATAAPKELPEIWCYSMPGCVPCVRAKLELAAEKDLPFQVVWKDEAAPDWLKTRPAFWWHTTGDKPSQADVNNTRQTTGWNGVRDFIERWKASRSPKKFSRSFQSGQPDASGTVDHNQTRTVVRYHDGHNCWSCGRTQYIIFNQHGPGSNTHIHRCFHCQAQWYHRDAK